MAEEAKKGGAGCAIAVVLIAVLAVATMCNRDSGGRTSKQTTSASPAAVGPYVAPSSDTALASAAREAIRRGEAGDPPLFIIVKLAGTDGYGNNVELDGFTLMWSVEDRARINWKNMDSRQLIELATLKDEGVDSIHGARSLNEWCAEHRAETPSFCRRWAEAMLG